MDAELVTLGATLILVVALVWAIWWLVASVRRDRRRQGLAVAYRRRYRVDWQTRPAHLFCGQGDALTVAELVEEARERGDALRLNWPDDDLNNVRRVRPYALGHVPTAILPVVDVVELTVGRPSGNPKKWRTDDGTSTSVDPDRDSTVWREPGIRIDECPERGMEYRDRAEAAHHIGNARFRRSD